VEHAVAVAGPTGKTGRQVVLGAAARGWAVRRVGRSDAGGPGTWAALDWSDPASWAPAFTGCDAAYLLIPFTQPGAAEATPGVLAAAADAGVRRIVLLSSWDAGHAADDDPLVLAERALLDLPVAAAVLRPTWFLDNFTHGSFAAMTADGQLRLPAGTGRIPQVDTRDIADVAVAALAPDGPAGTLPVTGPTAVDHHEIAAALSAAARRPITYTPVAAAEFVELLCRRGFTTGYGEFLADALEAVADGRLQIPVADTVARVTGHPARSVADFARHHADLLRRRP
jgi:uncharacterized protein YbjT (DUF2867 family)